MHRLSGQLGSRGRAVCVFVPWSFSRGQQLVAEAFGLHVPVSKRVLWAQPLPSLGRFPRGVCAGRWASAGRLQDPLEPRASSPGHGVELDRSQPPGRTIATVKTVWGSGGVFPEFDICTEVILFLEFFTPRWLRKMVCCVQAASAKPHKAVPWVPSPPHPPCQELATPKVHGA